MGMRITMGILCNGMDYYHGIDFLTNKNQQIIAKVSFKKKK